MSNDIDELKKAQDSLNQRKEKLLKQFIPLRKQFVAGLCEFTKIALQKGLHNVKLCDIKKETEEFFFVTLRLNGLDLVILSNIEVYFLKPGDKNLAAKLFIYLQGNENTTSHVEVVLRESRVRPRVLANWLTPSGIDYIVGERIVVENSGQRLADDLIDHFYRFLFFWEENQHWEICWKVSLKCRV
jgi:hypothetical protein